MTVRGVHLCECGSPQRVYTERTCNHCGKVALHDVDDINGWVHAAINKRFVRLPSETRDELAAEGIRIVTRMARDYQPGRGGLDASASTFSGYLGKFLEGKLLDAWHRLEDHTLKTREDGSRAWNVKPAQISINALDDPNDSPGLTPTTLQVEDVHDTDDVISNMPRLDAWWTQRRQQVIRYGELRSQGYRNNEIADEMELLPAQVKELEKFVREALPQPGRVAA